MLICVATVCWHVSNIRTILGQCCVFSLFSCPREAKNTRHHYITLGNKVNMQISKSIFKFLSKYKKWITFVFVKLHCGSWSQFINDWNYWIEDMFRYLAVGTQVRGGNTVNVIALLNFPQDDDITTCILI